MKAKICPQCRENTIMDKITVKDVIIDMCPVCKGIYYDRGEMKKVLAGSLDAETVLSRLPYDGSDFICPSCSVNMDKISARKGDLYYEMYFCRSCLATFLRNEELLKVKQKLSGSVFRQPSALRPKAVFDTTFARTQTPKPEVLMLKRHATRRIRRHIRPEPPPPAQPIQRPPRWNSLRPRKKKP